MTSMGFEDKLLFLDTPIDPAGDPVNPYPEWAKRRAANPIEVDTERFGEGGTLVYLYRQADVVACLQNDKEFSSKALLNIFSEIIGGKFLVGLDEPEHGRYRNLVAPALRPKLIKKWEEGLIHKVIDEIIAKIAHVGKADLVKDVTFAYPARVVSHIVGLPQDNFEQFQRWAIDIVGAAADPGAASVAANELRAYFAPFVEERRANPKDDMMSELLHAEVNGEKLTDEEIYSFLLFLLPAGIETTYRAFGNLLFHLLTNPQQLEAVAQNRELVPKAIEEALRMDTPIQITPRLTLQDVEFNGVKIPADSLVIPVIGAANHDPEFIENPDVFDINRPIVRHITFGNGVHTCVGLHLAKLEINIALNKLLDAMPNLRFDEEAMKETVTQIRGKSFRSPTALPVKWDL